MEFSRERLEQMPFFQLRQIGREIGVYKSSTYKKAQLIDAIIDVCSGKVKPQYATRGRPAKPSVNIKGKSMKLSEEDLKKIDRLFEKFKEDLLKIISDS